MSIWHIIGIASAVGIGVVVFGALAIMLLIVRMEEYQRDLEGEGVRIDGELLHDLEPGE